MELCGFKGESLFPAFSYRAGVVRFLWHNPRQLNFQRKATWRCFALSLPLLFQSLNFHEKNHLERFMYWLICEFSAIYLGFCEEYCVVHKNLVRRPVK